MPLNEAHDKSLGYYGTIAGHNTWRGLQDFLGGIEIDGDTAGQTLADLVGITTNYTPKKSATGYEDSGLSWSGNDASFAGNIDASLADIDNIRIDGNTISSTDTNGNIILSANGSGVITSSQPLHIAGSHFGATGTVPSTGIYTDIGYSVGGSKGFIQTYNRTSSAFVPLSVNNAMELLANGNVHVGGTTDPGVKFGVTGAISATTGITVATGQDVLDAYEEGEYTATLTCGTSGTITLNTSYDTLGYIKIGNLCHVQGIIRASSISSPLGTLLLNLPFTAASLTDLADCSRGVIYVRDAATLALRDFSLAATQASASALIQTATGADFADAASEIAATSQIYVSLSYITA